MAGTIQVDIVSAEGEIYSGPAKMVFLPAAEGEIGVAPRHAPLLALLKAGEVRVQPEEGDEQSFYVGGGALEVQPTKVTVLADTAARAADLDEAAALAARARAEEALAGKIDKLEQAEALAELARAAAQLRLIERLRKIRG
ncbi:MAG: F0F1 ATP synthase subunit epsilon [Gammaproteobacteria bacterium]|nr:F0F1 ATP synthase subunit epsilon [Gammaproteobacteria bacterium]MDE2250200.1 F0F1 ATP synthase subunit epsilon [Gammaproteobacteria bacterium]